MNPATLTTPEKKALTGRPFKYSVEQMKTAIDNYFSITPFEDLTITGLALSVGTTRNVLLNYRNKDEFADMLNEARERIHNAY